MWEILSVLLIALAIGLMRVSLFASGVCWVALYFVGSRADQNTRESRIVPWVIMAATVAYLVRTGIWVWHVI